MWKFFCYKKHEKVVYKNLSDYIEVTIGTNVDKEQITELSIHNVIIEDFTALNELTNLKTIYLNSTYLKGIDFSVVPNLESVCIDNSTLDGTLNFSKNYNLKLINVCLSGNKANAYIDIRR